MNITPLTNRIKKCNVNSQTKEKVCTQCKIDFNEMLSLFTYHEKVDENR